jgi:hypothetical protein
MKQISIVWLLAGLGGLTACSSHPVKATYVSPTQYQSFTCPQLHSEYKRLQQYIENGVETPKRTGMGVGIGLGGGWGSRSGWGLAPNVSVNLGQSSNTQRTELSRLLGQQDAIVQAAEFKGCPIAVRRKG